MRFSFEYIDFPLSKTLTQKSRMIGMFTHPIFSFFLSGLFMVVMAYAFNTKEMVRPIAFMSMAILILGFIFLPKYRKKRFAELKEEYRKMLEAQK